MNITVTADAETITRAQAYAEQRGTSLDQLIRDYLRQLTERPNAEAVAKEFAELAMTQGGRSPEGWVFSREAAHQR